MKQGPRCTNDVPQSEGEAVPYPEPRACSYPADVNPTPAPHPLPHPDCQHPDHNLCPDCHPSPCPTPLFTPALGCRSTGSAGWMLRSQTPQPDRHPCRTLRCPPLTHAAGWGHEQGMNKESMTVKAGRGHGLQGPSPQHDCRVKLELWEITNTCRL